MRSCRPNDKCSAMDIVRARHQTNRRGGWGKVRPEDCCRPNGSDVKLRGQGPRGYGRAARRLPACEARDAGGVTPRKLRRTRRLGRRTEAGPRQLLRRVSRPIRPPANRRKQGLKHLERIKSDWPTTKIDTYLKYALGIGAIAYPQMKHVLAVWVQA